MLNKRKRNKRPATPQVSLVNKIPRGLQRHFTLLVWGGIIFGAVLIGVIVSFFLLFFRIQTVEIIRNEEDSNLQFSKMQMMMEHTKEKNLLILSSSFLKKQLFISFPELTDIEITKQLPNTLILTPKTDTIAFKWIYKTHQDPENQYVGYVSQKGLYLRYGADESFPIFEIDMHDDYLSPITQLISPEEIEKIKTAKSMIEEVTKRKMERMIFLRNAQEMHFIDTDETQYWLFLKSDIPQQIAKLQTAISQRNIYKTKVEYIDLRISRKVIYKPK